MKRVGMGRVDAALLLLGVQLLLVLSIAGKYLYERKTRPRVWVRTTQYDPATPLRGRYLALQPVVDACGLPRDKEHADHSYDYLNKGIGAWTWEVTLVAEGGQLTPKLAESARRDPASTVRLADAEHCARARVDERLLYFIPEHARTQFPLAAGHELWVEVTVPVTGPPRPIQLAIAGADGFKPLHSE